MQELRILTVFTGGTIGSAQQEGMLRPAGEDARSFLLAHFADERQGSFEERFQKKISFDTVCPYEILSENLNGDHLEKLETCIWEKGVENYEGIIVATGTDTLAYSSAALGYAFADIPIPMVIVSANYPLWDERSNGFSNFEGAMLVILEGGHKGVFCSYDNGGEHFIHYAARLLPQMNYSHRVESVMGKVYGRIEGMSLVREESKQMKQEEDAKDIVLSCKGLTDHKVCFIRPYPGIMYTAADDCSCVLLDTYHSGTLPVIEGGFRDFLKEMQRRNIPVFAAGVPEGLVYETVDIMKKAGVIVLPPASPAAMYMKLWMALGSKPDLLQLIKIISQNKSHDLDF